MPDIDTTAMPTELPDNAVEQSEEIVNPTPEPVQPEEEKKED